MSRESHTFCNRLSDMIANKRKEPTSILTNWIRTKLNFALLKSCLLCLQGSRTPWNVTRNIININEDISIESRSSRERKKGSIVINNSIGNMLVALFTSYLCIVQRQPIAIKTGFVEKIYCWFEKKKHVGRPDPKETRTLILWIFIASFIRNTLDSYKSSLVGDIFCWLTFYHIKLIT